MKVYQRCLNWCRGTDRSNNNLRWFNLPSPIFLWVEHLVGLPAAAYLGFVLIVTGVVLICASLHAVFHCMLRFDCSAAAPLPIVNDWPPSLLLGLSLVLCRRLSVNIYRLDLCFRARTIVNVHTGIIGPSKPFRWWVKGHQSPRIEAFGPCLYQNLMHLVTKP